MHTWCCNHCKERCKYDSLDIAYVCSNCLLMQCTKRSKTDVEGYYICPDCGQVLGKRRQLYDDTIRVRTFYDFGSSFRHCRHAFERDS